MSSLGNDLSLIRKHRGLSLEDIRSTTKIPMDILVSIENDTIFSDPRQNATYIRSYVRSYAKALKIENDLIVRALDQQKANRYGGLLRELLTDLEQKLKKGPRFRLDDDAADEPDQEKATDEEKETADEEKRDEKPSGTGMAAPEPEIDPAGSESAEPETHETAEERNGARVPEPPVVESVDWANMGKRFVPMQTRPRIWMGIVAAIILLAIAAFFIIYGFGTEGSVTGETNGSSGQQVLTPDSLQLNLSPEQSRTDTPAGVTGSGNDGGSDERVPVAAGLSDTLSLVIYAAHSQLDPVRVYTDVSNTLNPYWIEHGEAISFDFVNTIRIRGEYQQMELIFNGHLVENFTEQFFNADSRMLEIGRSFFEAGPLWLQPAPDSLGNGLPFPSVIRERPTFN